MTSLSTYFIGYLKSTLLVKNLVLKSYVHVSNFGEQVGLKPAGGLKTAQDAVNWLVLVHSELGPEWLSPKLFRIGASSLLNVIEDHLLQNGTKIALKKTDE